MWRFYFLRNQNNNTGYFEKVREADIVVSMRRYGEGTNANGAYHTQRNNKVDPQGTCNVTSYVMASKRAGAMFEVPVGMQAEDYFAGYLKRKEAIRVMREAAPWAFYGNGSVKIKPYEVHTMLRWGYNKIANGVGVAEFGIDRTLQELIWMVQVGAGVVVSGDFPNYRGNRLAHIVSIGDVVYSGDCPESPNQIELDRFEAFIIDDPWGDYRVGYNPDVTGYEKGNNVIMRKADVVEYLKNSGENEGYWAHVIVRN